MAVTTNKKRLNWIYSLEGKMEAYLKARGLTLTDADKAGLKAIDAATAKAMAFNYHDDGTLIPYFHPFLPNKQLDTIRRLRLFKPAISREGKEVRYVQPAGSSAEAYFTRRKDWESIAGDVKQIIDIVEGEVKALALAKIGLITIGLGGVNSYGGETLTPLLNLVVWKGRDVFINFDSDAETKPGVKAARNSLARILTARGAIVRTPILPNVIPGGKTGVDDFIVREGAKAFLELRKTAPVYVGRRRVPDIERLEEVKRLNVEWLWKPYLAVGMLSLLSGDPSSAKTFIGLSIAATLSNGREPFPDRNCQRLTTLYMSNETSTAYVIKDRFRAMGGFENRFRVLKGSTWLDDGTSQAIDLKDIDLLEQAVLATRARLLIVDPVQSYMGDADSHKATEVRPILDGLIKLAERQKISILIIRHLSKATASRAIHRGMGSIDFSAAARTEMLAGTVPGEPSGELERVMAQIKNSLGKLAPSLAFSIVEGKKDSDARLEWQGISRRTAADLLAPDKKNTCDKSRLDLAVEYLRIKLKDGPRLIKELEEEGDFNIRMLQRAGRQMHIKPTRDGRGGKWMWQLPKLKLPEMPE